jgi:hypothetical protein
MQSFEYLLGLVSILIGIAIADIALSLHKLTRAVGRVRWHWHSLASTLIVVLLVLDFWWGLRQLEKTKVTMTIGLFLPMLSALIAFFLLAAAALPDDIPAEGVDLESYYDTNRRHFWTLFSIYIFLSSVHVVFIFSALKGWQATVLERLPSNLLPNLLIIGLAASLTRIRNGWWNSAVLIFLLVALLNSHLTRPLA